MTTTRPTVNFKDTTTGLDSGEFHYVDGPAVGHNFSSIVCEGCPEDNTNTYETVGWLVATLGVMLFAVLLIGNRFIKK